MDRDGLVACDSCLALARLREPKLITLRHRPGQHTEHRSNGTGHCPTCTCAFAFRAPTVIDTSGDTDDEPTIEHA